MSTSIPPPSSPSAASPQGAVCGACATSVDPLATVCPLCGFPRPRAITPGRTARSGGRAMFYSLLWPGAGHLYASDSKPGLVFAGISSLFLVLSLTLSSVGISVILWLATAIYAMIDSNKKVRLYNAQHGFST